MKVAAKENRKVAMRVAKTDCYLAATMELAKGSSLVATTDSERDPMKVVMRDHC